MSGGQYLPMLPSGLQPWGNIGKYCHQGHHHHVLQLQEHYLQGCQVWLPWLYSKPAQVFTSKRSNHADKNLYEIALRRLGAVVGAERVDGVTPLLLAAQEGHVGRHHHSSYHQLHSSST